MKYTTFLFSACFILITHIAHGQNNSLWRSENISTLPSSDSYNPKPIASVKYQLEFRTFAKGIAIEASKRESKQIELPLASGQIVTFTYEDSKLMEEPLASKYPMIKGYKGVSLDGKYLLRFDLSPNGINATIAGEEGLMFITPTFKNNTDYYDAYYAKNASFDDFKGSCGVAGEFEELRPTKAEISNLRSAQTINKQQYRIAMACTGEWGAVRGTKEKALADMVTSLNILNAIYEIDLGITFVMIGRNDTLLQLNGATDPYTNPTSGGGTLGENTRIINELVGVASYDIGHVFTVRCTDVGGVAYLRAICAGNKGGGVSCVGDNLVRNTYQIVAHEIGHQLGANHTFHSCGENVSLGNDFEPGSGSTIMAYGGLCGTDNVVSGNDPYFHNGSLIEIYENIREPEKVGYKCAVQIPTQDEPPMITAMPTSGKTIPARTPFMLLGSATDVNKDNLTYVWEQKDSTLLATPLGSPSGNAPFARSFPPSTLDYRIFPRPAILLNNSSEKSEVLPTYSRNVNFAFTVRDNNKESGYASWAFMNFKVDGNSGPLEITSPNTAFTKEVGEVVDVKWDVNKTDLAPVNCKKVDIYLSLDGILDPRNTAKMILLSAGTPNDGSESIVLPNAVTVQGRLVVKASDNIFFDVNNAYFSIIQGTKQRAYFEVPVINSALCLPATSDIVLKSTGLVNYAGKIKYVTQNVPNQVKATFDRNDQVIGQDVSLKLEMTNQLPSGVYTIQILGIGDNNDTLIRTLLYEVTSTDFTNIKLIGPVDGLKNNNGLPNFIWSKNVNAVDYKIEVADSPTFAQSNIVATLTTSDTMATLNKTLDKAKIFYWRVKASNACGSSTGTLPMVFGTEVLNCKVFEAKDIPINITQSGRPTIESKTNVDANFKISDLNVKDFSIEHDFLKDVGVTLISPKGTSVVLFDAQCPRKMTLNCSFDDEASNFFSCSTTSGLQFKAQGLLSSFDGEDAFGQWTIKVEDKTSGNGGRLNSTSIEFCGNIPVDNPAVTSLVNVFTPYKTTVDIKPDNLTSKDATSAANLLTYVVVQATQYGNVLFNGSALKIGDTFTQSDVDALKLRYANVGPDNFPNPSSILDSMVFVVRDPDGGWEGSKALKFFISNGVTGVNDATFDYQAAALFPNPTNGLISLKLPDSVTDKVNVTIYNTNGQMVYKRTITANLEQLDLTSLLRGTYFARIVGEKYISTASFIRN